MDPIEQEVATIVGGEFTRHSLAPADYEEVVGRVRAQPDAYLDAFERLYLGTRFDAELHSQLHPAVLLRLLREVAPERARALAASLLRQYDAVLVIYYQYPDKAALDQLLPRQTANYLVRLSEHRRELRRLAEEP